MSQIASLPCPLCGTDNALPFHHDKFRKYVQCGVCDLVFVPRAFHLSAEAEKKYYDLHENHPDDQDLLKRFISGCGSKLSVT